MRGAVRFHRIGLDYQRNVSGWLIEILYELSVVLTTLYKKPQLMLNPLGNSNDKWVWFRLPSVHEVS